MQILQKPKIDYHKITSSDIDVKFSILIPSWNNFEMLKLCIESVLKNSAYKHQIIVHVNEGTDGTLDWIKKQQLDYSFSEENAGVCHSVNAMASMAETNYLLYLNDDMYVCPNWDKVMWNEVLKQKNEFWYLSGTMIEPVYSKNKCAISPHDFGNLPSNFKENELLAFTKKVKKNDWFGASWPPSLVHKNLFKKVNGYSEEFSPGMYSDPDFSIKLWHAGVRNFKGLGNCLVYHFQSKSTGRVVRNNGRKQFAAKWKIPASYFNKNVICLGETFSENKPLKFSKNLFFYLAQVRAFLITLKK